MNPHKNIQPRRYRAPETLSAPSNESSYWKRFQLATDLHEPSVSDICVSATTLAIAHNAPRVNLYSLYPSVEFSKSISRGLKEPVTSVSIRSDERLVVLGDAVGDSRLYDFAKASLLRTFRSQSKIRVVAFWDSLRVLSASDDHAIKIWDIGTAECQDVLTGHSDYIKRLIPLSATTLVSASYDGTVRLWDTRTEEKMVIEFRDDKPVEDALAFSSEKIFASASGTKVRLWDALYPERPIDTLENHSKTVTSLAWKGTEGPRNGYFLTGGLDRLVKAVNASLMQVEHTWRCSSPVLRLSVTPDGDQFIVGMTSGYVQHFAKPPDRSRESVSADDVQRSAPEGAKGIVGGSSRLPSSRKETAGVLQRKLQPSPITVITRPVSQKFTDVENHLIKFRFAEAIDLALKIAKDGDPKPLIHAIHDLRLHSNGLYRSIRTMTQKRLILLLEVVAKHVSSPQCAETLASFLEIVISLHEDRIVQSEDADRLVSTILRKIQVQAAIQRQIDGVLAGLDSIALRGKLAPVPASSLRPRNHSDSAVNNEKMALLDQP